MSFNEIIIPFSLWSGSIPSHRITCVLFLGCSRIVTGSETGEIILWSFYNNKLIPEFIMIGHHSSISDIIHDTYLLTECIVSVSIDGTLCVWDVKDGYCLNSSYKLLKKYYPLSMVSLGNNIHIIISGHSNEAVIINILKMKIENIANHNNWIQSIYPNSLFIKDSGYTFISLCDNIIRFWAYYNKKLENIQLTLLDLDDDIRFLFVCPSKITYVIITDTCWILYSASNSRCLETNKCPFNDGWIGGEYIDCNHIILWTYNGNICIYRLSDISSLYPMGKEDKMINTNDKYKLKSSILLYYYKLDFTSNPSSDINKVLGTKLSFTISPDCLFICVTNERGYVNIYNIPRLQLNEDNIGNNDNILEKDKLDNPHILNIYLSSSIFECFENTSNTLSSHNPTSSCILQDSFSLISGYDNGNISIQKLPSDNNIKKLKHYHHGKVTALLQVEKDDTNILLTGGDDCLIHALDIDTGDLRCTWPDHCATILHLLPINSSYIDNITIKGCFMSIASDFSIGIFSYDPYNVKSLKIFTGHKASIQCIQLRNDQDYLFVTCSDNTVTIWEFSTGNYEGCYNIDSIKEITQMSMITLYSSTNKSPDVQSSIQNSLTLYSQNLVPYSDIIFINIRQLINQIYTNKLLSVDYDLQSILQYISYLVPWNINDDIDNLATLIGIKKPQNNYSPGLLGKNGNFSLFFPKKDNKSIYPLSISSYTTSKYFLAFLSPLMSLFQTLKDDNIKENVHKLVQQMYFDFENVIPTFQRPCFGVLSNYWNDKLQDIQQATKNIFYITFDSQTPNQRTIFLDKWFNKLESKQLSTFKTNTKPALLLGIIGSERTSALNHSSPIYNKLIAQSLCNIILNNSEISSQIFAASLAIKGYSIWGNFIENIDKIFKQLLIIQTPLQPDKYSLSEHITISFARILPKEFINCVSLLTKSASFPPNGTLSALKVTKFLIKTNSFLLIDDLHHITEYIIRSINPSHPTEKKCGEIGRKLLSLMNSTYPMVTFHKPSQQFAVGGGKNQIFIFDIKTYTRIHILSERHHTPVSSICYSSDGKVIASYSAKDTMVCFWQNKTSLFSGNSIKCTVGLSVKESYQIEPLQKFLTTLKMEWENSTTLKISQGNISSTLIYNKP